MGCCCIELKTPQAVLDEDMRDVFEEIIPDTQFLYEEKRAVLWGRYRYRGIPTCNLEYWIQCMQDRYLMIVASYDMKLCAFDTLYNKIGSDGPDFSDGSTDYNMVTEYEDMPDNPATDTRYLSNRSTVKYDMDKHDNLETQTVKDYIKAIPDTWEEFAKEFERYFWIGV